MSAASRPVTFRTGRAATSAVASLALAGMLGMGVAGAATATSVGTGPGSTPGSDQALAQPFDLAQDRDVSDRLAQPEDRYALAGGCYVIASGDGYVGADVLGSLSPNADREQAIAFHARATELGRYLFASNEGASDVPGADWDDRRYLAAPGAAATGRAFALTLADDPSFDADWLVEATGDDPDARDVEGQGYAMSLPEGAYSPVELSNIRFELADGCARWPEITTNTSGAPAPTGADPAAAVQGFFEAHIHGMAFEFLGGELRCGQPWHRWGVEFALPDCSEDGSDLNGVLEVGLAGQSPADPVTSYDPVGWPTFSYWPKHDTLTHEQYYYKWLERAYHGGLRLTTWLLVENTALCQLYPLKKNSCNEMDSVRLQAQRAFELQDYIDAQSGGPGEGWLRIVTTPAQAREAINDGRLAIVLGIEVSELFDCREILDQPQCTEESISTSLTEVADMGVRQMELLNKFDSALAGVTGDGGATGVIVNQGQKIVSGHYWDMRTCEELTLEDQGSHAHDGSQTDKLQMNFNDDVAQGNADEIDVLAGIIIEQFGPAANPTPVYPAGPHCNTRGLTDLGAYLITEMAETGILFDPDHMSALAQRQALDLLEDEIVPAMHADADANGTPRRNPGVLSSHSWGNDVIYQRIFDLDGVVAPRTSDAFRFVDRWVQRRAWHEEHAPAGAFFGLGYGADTNGLGGQPGPSGGLDDANRITNDAAGFKAPIGDVTIFQQVSGVKPFDINTDGAAHYGLFADWYEEVVRSAEQKLGAEAAAQLQTDMLNGAEDYLQTWERAVYGSNDCVVDGSTLQHEDLHAAVGLQLEQFLTQIGQPLDRDGAAYIYCVEGANGQAEAVTVSFEDGTASSVADSDRDVSDLAVAAGADSHDDLGEPLAATGGGAAALAAMLLGGAGMLGTASRRKRRGAE